MIYFTGLQPKIKDQRNVTQIHISSQSIPVIRYFTSGKWHYKHSIHKTFAETYNQSPFFQTKYITIKRLIILSINSLNIAKIVATNKPSLLPSSKIPTKTPVKPSQSPTQTSTIKKTSKATLIPTTRSTQSIPSLIPSKKPSSQSPTKCNNDFNVYSLQLL